MKMVLHTTAMYYLYIYTAMYYPYQPKNLGPENGHAVDRVGYELQPFNFRKRKSWV